MNIKNTIIEHYRKFFDLYAKGIALDEDDHLNIDWAEDLVKNCFIPNVVGQSEQLVCSCSDGSSMYRDKEDNDMCYDCDLPIAN
jgi:hypothetical protein